MASLRSARGVACSRMKARDAVRHLRHAVRLRPVGEGAEGQRRIVVDLPLEGDGAGQDAAVEFRQHDMHGEVGGRQAALVVCPGVAALVATMTWNTGTPARSNSVSTPGSAPVAKAVAVMMAVGLSAAIAVSTKASDVGSFKLETKMGTGAMPRCGSAAKCVDGRHVGGEQHRAVEEDGDGGC